MVVTAFQRMRWVEDRERAEQNRQLAEQCPDPDLAAMLRDHFLYYLPTEGTC